MSLGRVTGGLSHQGPIQKLRGEVYEELGGCNLSLLAEGNGRCSIQKASAYLFLKAASLFELPAPEKGGQAGDTAVFQEQWGVEIVRRQDWWDLVTSYKGGVREFLPQLYHLCSGLLVLCKHISFFLRVFL